MSTLSAAMSDSATMIRRNFRHTVRYPVTIVASLGVPVIMLLLFVGVFGGALGASLGFAGYVDYVVPGILLMTAGYGCSTTALAVNKDMTAGIIDRFRTMAIARASVLTGHVAGAMARTLISIALVIAVAVLIGFRPAAGIGDWLAVAGVLVLFVLALTWLAVAIGLTARSPEGTSGFTLIVQVLPFVSSAFVSPDSMSAPARWFAENEPFTPVIDTVRGLLMGTPIGNAGVIAIAWCVGLAVVGYLWARAQFNRVR
ncbi:MAG: ABC transporter permease [Kibdelosporangium sp.]